MISTRDNLLIRPWQQRKYEYHKKKVLSATPVIDNKSPPYRGHVAVKLKKLQKENERSEKIERDNLILLQKLNYIMSTHWLDNYLPPQPTFLSRVGVYRPVDFGIDIDDIFKSADLDIQKTEETLESKPKCKKLKCLACSPHKFVDTVQIPEERVPWEPLKKSVGRRRSSSVPPKRSSEPLPTITEKPKSASTFEETKKTLKSLRAKHEERSKTELSKDKEKVLFSTNALIKHPNSISISRGSLKLSVNFPSDTVVKFDKKRMGQKVCRCLRSVQS